MSDAENAVDQRGNHTLYVIRLSEKLPHDQHGIESGDLKRLSYCRCDLEAKAKVQVLDALDFDLESAA